MRILKPGSLKTNFEDFYKKALSLDTNSIPAMHALAMVYDQNKKWDQSDKLYTDLITINTKDLAQRISAELKRYSIPQAIFAQRVLCRSQGTLSDLLRNPKPWSKLKSGRETFRRMQKWLSEPEFQRMSSLRLAGNELFEIYYGLEKEIFEYFHVLFRNFLKH